MHVLHSLPKPNIRALCALMLTIAALAVVTAAPLSVSAEQGSSDPVYIHCVKTLPNKTQSACTDEAHVITYARNAASWKCNNSGDPEKCVVNKANDFIDDAAKKKNSDKNVQDFKDNLVSVLKGAVGDKYKKANDLSTDNKSYSDPAADVDCSYSGGCDFIAKYINPAITLLTVVFGLVAVISIILGAIQYITSTGDPQKVSKAKQRITNTIIAIVCYFFLYAFLQFLIPGGIFD